MLTITLSSEGNAAFQQRVELEGVNYVLDFVWVERAGCWSHSVYTDDGTLVVAGLAVVSNRPLYRHFHHLEGLPPGELVHADLTATVPAPPYDGLTELVYFTAAEWAARKDG